MLRCNYQVLESAIQEAGKYPNAPPSIGIIFNLPDTLSYTQPPLLTCRTISIEYPVVVKMNDIKIWNIAEVHKGNKKDWFFDMAILPKNCLKKGQGKENRNELVFTADWNNDDIIQIDNVVLWYYTDEK